MLRIKPSDGGNLCLPERKDLLPGIRNLLSQGRPVAISGLDGLGKTTLAHVYARQFAKRYKQVFKLNGATWVTLLADCIALGNELGFPIQQEQNFALTIQWIQDWLQMRRDYLLILDNIEDQVLMKEVLPRRMAGHILLIAQSPITMIPCTNIALDELEQENGALLVLPQTELRLPLNMPEQVGEGQHSAASALACELGGFPLALSQAGGYIKQTGCQISDYIQMYRSYDTQAVDAAQLSDAHAEALTITVGLSLAWLAREQPVAVLLLHTCAFLSPHVIPTALFTQAEEEVSETLQGLLLPALALQAMLEMLQELGLLTCQPETRSFTLASQIQRVLREALSEQEYDLAAQRALQVLDRPFLWAGSAWQRLQMSIHVQQVSVLHKIAHCICEEEARLLGEAARVLWEHQCYREAGRMLQRALVICEGVEGARQPMLADLLERLAAVLEKQGDYAQAQQRLQRAVLLRLSQGVYQKEIVVSLNNLGSLYLEQGKVEEAEECYRKALWIGGQLLGSADPLIAGLQADLGMLYLQEENYAEAEAYFVRALETWEQVGGEKEG
ncbi:MAG TPA: tetratricopeptide repeat protein, partial [Ktedonobacteraceae bacterium]|nr:tetratricopeptide repeat protein [Ktedonobacteraceae bacterium]